MRIIAGEFKSRHLKTLPGKNTRPTLDKVRESFFHKIGPYFEGGTALDLYGGSGAVGLEALSRGMDFVYIADVSKAAVAIIKENVQSLKVQDRCKVLNMRDQSVLNFCQQNHISFDFIYLDPPYGYSSLNRILESIDTNHLLSESGQCLVECGLEDEINQAFNSMELVESVIYGISKIYFFRRRQHE